MKIISPFRDALRRLRTPAPAALSATDAARRTRPLPSIMTHSPRAEPLPKPTPANLRRFAETPVARKAINTIKDRVAGMRWRIQPKAGVTQIDNDRIAILTRTLNAPNPDDSFRSFAEQVLEAI